MNCASTRALLDLHLEDRLPEARSRAVAEHLKGCAECARLARALRPAKAGPAPMPPELKEKLRQALLKAQPAPDAPEAAPEPEPPSALSFSSAALVALALCLPFASLVGAWDPDAGLGAALRLGTLAGIGALLLHGLLSGRLSAPRRLLPAIWIAGALIAWEACVGAVGPAFALPSALDRAAGPALFLTSAFALGGGGEAKRLLKAAAASAAGLALAALVAGGRVSPLPSIERFEPVGAALTILLAAAVLVEAARAFRAFGRLGAPEERGVLAALLGAALALAAVAWTSLPALAAAAWLCAGAACGLCALASSGEPFATAALPFERIPRRALAAAFAACLALLAVFPARWLADDFKVAGARRLLALAGSESDAVSRLDEVLNTSPSWPAAQLLAGDALLAQGRPAEALARLLRLDGDAPDYPGLAYREGLAYGKLGDWTRALACHERARALRPGDVSNLERLAVAAKMRGDFTRARQAALSAIALEPKDPAHWLALSDIALREKNARDAARRGERHVRRPQAKKKTNL